MHSHSGCDPIVYIVDDDRDVREGLASLFESVGLRAQAFQSTQEFLQSNRTDAHSCLVLEPIQEVTIQEQRVGLVNRRSMMRIIASRMNAAADRV